MKGILVGWQDDFTQPSNIPPIAGQRRSTSPDYFTNIIAKRPSRSLSFHPPAPGTPFG
jgi:hypothetical protein